MSLLEVKGLKVDLPTCGNVLNSVSLTIGRGEVCGLVGESGSGKTTLALSILRLLPKGAKIKGGQILFGMGDEKNDLLSLSAAEMRKMRGRLISMVPQEPGKALNPVMKVGDQILEAILAHKKITKDVGRRAVLDLLRSVCIDEPERIYNSYPHELSGGMKQRILIAMGVSLSPRLIIADEPTSALDPTIRAGIINLLGEISSSTGTSILLITHDMEVASAIATHIAVMYKGMVLESGKKEEVLQGSLHPYTGVLIAASTKLCKPRMPEDPASPSRDGCPFYERCWLRKEVCKKMPEMKMWRGGHLVACHMVEGEDV